MVCTRPVLSRLPPWLSRDVSIGHYVQAKRSAPRQNAQTVSTHCSSDTARWIPRVERKTSGAGDGIRRESRHGKSYFDAASCGSGQDRALARGPERQPAVRSQSRFAATCRTKATRRARPPRACSQANASGERQGCIRPESNCEIIRRASKGFRTLRVVFFGISLSLSREYAAGPASLVMNASNARSIRSRGFVCFT
jgi:hypothetical protein